MKPPEWIKVIPGGTTEIRNDGRDWLFDDTSRKAMAIAFLVCPLPRINFDHNHNSQPVGRIVALKNRDDGLWAKAEWTDEGAAAVIGNRYKFLSPEVDAIERNGKLYAWKLTGLALTNRNAITDLRIMNDTMRDDFVSGAAVALRRANLSPADLRHRAWLLQALAIMGVELPDYASNADIKTALLYIKNEPEVVNRAGNVDVELDYRLELTTLLGLDAQASDDSINYELGYPRGTQFDDQQELCRILELPEDSDDDQIEDALSEREHQSNVVPSQSKRMSNANTEKIVWHPWGGGNPRMSMANPTETDCAKLAHKLGDTRNEAQLRALSRQYTKGSFMRSHLEALADERMPNDARPDDDDYGDPDFHNRMKMKQLVGNLKKTSTPGQLRAFANSAPRGVYRSMLEEAAQEKALAAERIRRAQNPWK